MASFHVDYEAESCPGETCKPLETNFQIVNSAYARKTKGLDYAVSSYESCVNSNKEKCNTSQSSLDTLIYTNIDIQNRLIIFSYSTNIIGENILLYSTDNKVTYKTKAVCPNG